MSRRRAASVDATQQVPERRVPINRDDARRAKNTLDPGTGRHERDLQRAGLGRQGTLRRRVGGERLRARARRNHRIGERFFQSRGGLGVAPERCEGEAEISISGAGRRLL